MLALPSPSRCTVQLNSNSMFGVNSSSGHEVVNSLKAELSGLSCRHKVFLKDMRWQGRASGMQGGVFGTKRLLKGVCCGRLVNGSAFESRSNSLAFHVGVGGVRYLSIIPLRLGFNCIEFGTCRHLKDNLPSVSESFMSCVIML